MREWAKFYVCKVATVICVMILAFGISASVTALAASLPVPSGSNTVTGKMIVTSKNGSSPSPLTTGSGDCGIDQLTMFNGGSSSQIDANWGVSSIVGDIGWENITVTLNNGGGSQTYNGPGPIISPNASGQFTFSGLRSKTTYTGTLSGWIENTDLFTCTLVNISTNATTK